MDAEGIDSVLLYPTIGICWEGHVTDPGLATAYTRAYNRWLVEFCQADRARLHPVALTTSSGPRTTRTSTPRWAWCGSCGSGSRRCPPGGGARGSRGARLGCARAVRGEPAPPHIAAIGDEDPRTIDP